MPLVSPGTRQEQGPGDGAGETPHVNGSCGVA